MSETRIFPTPEQRASIDGEVSTLINDIITPIWDDLSKQVGQGDEENALTRPVNTELSYICQRHRCSRHEVNKIFLEALNRKFDTDSLRRKKSDDLYDKAIAELDRRDKSTADAAITSE